MVSEIVKGYKMKKVLNGLFVLASLWCGTNVKAQEQKPALDHSVYKIWQNVGGFQLTDDGKYAAYLTNVGEGDGSVSLVDLKTSETTTVHRGSRANFSHNGTYMYFTIRPLEGSYILPNLIDRMVQCRLLLLLGTYISCSPTKHDST